MNTTAKFAAVTAIAAVSVSSPAIDETYDLPMQCRDAANTVAMLDCLQSRQEILQAVLNYQELLFRIEKTKSERAEVSKSNLVAPEPEPDNTLLRTKWFDDNMHVYAIVGNASGLTAHASLDGREYRLRKGDTVRLAQVSEVHPRGIKLSVAGQQLSIGLSGLPAKQ